MSLIRSLIRLSALAALIPLQCAAAVFSGLGDEGLGDASGIRTGGTGNLRASVWFILTKILSYMGLAAVVVIVIAGIFLIVGGGSDESRQKALKIVMYTLIGLIVILLASAFVRFIIYNAQV